MNINCLELSLSANHNRHIVATLSIEDAATSHLLKLLLVPMAKVHTHTHESRLVLSVNLDMSSLKKITNIHLGVISSYF